MSVLSSVFGDDAAILHETEFRLLLVANLVAPLGSALVSPMLDSLVDPFGASPTSIGLMISAFSAPAIFVIPFVGSLVDRYGRKPILVAGLTLFGTAGTLIAFTTDYTVVLLLRLLQGVGFAGTGPVIITSIGDRYEGGREATAQGLRFTGSGVAQTVAPLVAGSLVVVAWQYPFLLYAIAIPVAGLIHLWFEEPVDTARAPTADPAPGEDGSLWALLGHRRLQAMLLARGLPMFVWIGFVTYNSIVIVGILGASPAVAGVVAAIGSLGYAVTATQAGRIASRFDSRLVPLVVANVVLGVGFALFVYAPSVPVAGLGIAVCGGGFGVVLSLYRSVITGLAPEPFRGRVVGLAESTGRVVSTLTPVLMGQIVAVATAAVGFAPAVRLAGLTVALLATAGGVGCLLLASTAPPLPGP